MPPSGPWAKSSTEFVQTLIEHGLVDEIRLMIGAILATYAPAEGRPCNVCQVG